MGDEITGIDLYGDLNIHHARWLRHSNGNTTEGADLKILCEDFGMQQLTREPTRQQYLLDLFLTDIAQSSVEIGSYIADHKFIIAKVPVPEIKSLHFKRGGFKLARAAWSDLETALQNGPSISRNGSTEKWQLCDLGWDAAASNRRR